MKKTILLFTLLFGLTSLLKAQTKPATESQIRGFIDNAQRVYIERDWNNVAKFTTGIGETLIFMPANITDLNTGKTVKGLYVEMNVRHITMDAGSKLHSKTYRVTGWIDMDEARQLTEFLEKYVIPNIGKKFVKKYIQYTIRTKEMEMTFAIDQKSQIFKVKLKDYESYEGDEFYTFWTKTQVNKIPQLVELLKQLMEQSE